MALIEREALLEALRPLEPKGGHPLYREACNDMIHEFFPKLMEEQPTIDAAPVAHGRWIDSDEFKGFKMCSACRDCHIGEAWELGKDGRYCPGYGARMDGGEEHEAD